MFRYHLRARFHKSSLLGGLEGVDKIALDVHGSGQAAANEDGNCYLRFHHRGTCNIADISRHVVDHDGLSLMSGGPAKPLPDRKTKAGLETPGIRPQEQYFGLCILYDTENDVVIAWHGGVKMVGDALHHRLGIGGRLCQTLHLPQ